MAELKILSLGKTYPSGVKAVEDFSLEVKSGESVALFGLQRSGKSTLLRMLAGLESVSEGQILLDGKDITETSSKERNVAYVFQNTALDNKKNVYENLAYGLMLRKTPASVIDIKVKAVAEILGLSGVLTRKPKTLETALRLRVLLGRAVVREPNVYFFDDALSGLDQALKEKMLKDLVKLQTVLGATFLYATEDIREAVIVGNKVAILREGKLIQCDTPENLITAPADDFVREIMGVANN